MVNVVQQARRGERLERGVEPDAQARQQVERRIVRDEPLALAQHTGDTEEAYANYCHTKSSN